MCSPSQNILPLFRALSDPITFTVFNIELLNTLFILPLWYLMINLTRYLQTL